MKGEGRVWGALTLAAVAMGFWPGPQLARELRRAPEPDPVLQVEVARVADPAPEAETPAPPQPWLERVLPFCNERDVDLFTDLNPPPDTEEGTAHEAACFAMAGRIPKARALILGLPEHRRAEAAGTLFDVVANVMVADTNAAAGPVMELVLEFWPNHYLALFYAGSSRYRRGEPSAAGPFLERFLELYLREDQRTADARRMLETAQER